MFDKKKETPKASSGGSATTGGINFQAVVTAIAAVHLSRGIALNWLPGLVLDVPVSLLAESGGSGDDIRLVLKDGQLVEAQVKRGLAAGARLWEPMESMAKAIVNGDIAYGILVVSPDSSNTIRTHLAHDLTRIGDGRDDDLKDLAVEFKARLKPLGLDAQRVCSRLRVVVCRCEDGDDADVKAACAELTHLVEKQSDVRPAWNELYRDAERLMRLRGQREASAVLNVLASADVALRKGGQSPSALIAQLSEWVLAVNERYSVFGIDQPFPIDEGWIPINIIKRGTDEKVPTALAEAIQFYHDWDKRTPNPTGEGMAPEALGRFYRKGVVVAGPGMGKSTLMKKLARIYASENRPVLKVRLPLIAARMKYGAGFEEALFTHGLDGSGLSKQSLIDAAISNWVLLCDGLDECGQSQEELAQSLVAFASGHPQCSIVVATRPVGYTTALLNDWRHYELMPLAVDKEREHMGIMLQSIYPDDEPKREAILRFALEEIRASESSRAVARSPLLLGLVLYLAMRNVRFGKSKEQLYEKIFDIIDNIPNSRDKTQPPSKAVLLRFLEILAWDSVQHPISGIEQTLNRCAEILASELNQPLLSAKGTAEDCSEYWQTVGLLERVSHAGDETLTFIHKMFGEYAAGRFLARADKAVQAEVIPKFLGKDAVDEILSFAGALGAADVLCRELLNRKAGELQHAMNVGRALTLIAEANPAPVQPLRSEIYAAAIACARSEHELVAYGAASPLRECAKRFPDEVAPSVEELLASPHPWAQLTAWAVKLAAGPVYYTLPELEVAFATIPPANKSRFSSSLGGGIILRSTRDADLLESFVLAAMVVLLTQGDAERIDALIRSTFKLKGLQGWRLVTRAQRLLTKFGRDYSVVDLSEAASKLASTRLDPEGYMAASDHAFTKMIEPLTEGLDQVPPRKTGRLVWLSAFFELTDIWEMGASDIWGWKNDKYGEEAATVVSYVGQLVDIDRSRLAAEAREAITYVSETAEGQLHGFFERVAHVDTPPIDWSKARGRGFDLTVLEKALYHQSDWLMQLAARLLDGAATSTELEPIVERVLAIGHHTALWAAASLAATLADEVCERLLRAALKQESRKGFEYLFDQLSKMNPRVDEDLLSIVRSGLNAKHPLTAKAAAKLAVLIAQPAMEELSDMLRRAYAHWRVHEEPYPREGGVVPHSPRDEIVKALLKSSILTDDELFQMAADPRSDVQGVVKAEILERLKTDDSFRKDVLARTVGDSMPNRLLIEALREKQPFPAEDVQTILAMTGAASPKARYASLGILDRAYLGADVISEYLAKLAQDSEAEIRERAASIRRGKPT